MEAVGWQLLLAALGTQGSGVTGGTGLVEPDALFAAPGFGAVSPPPALQAVRANIVTTIAINWTCIDPPEDHPKAGGTLNYRLARKDS